MESLALHAAVHEARARIVGGVIRDVTQPDATALQLAIHRGPERHWLFLRGDRAVPAFCLVPHRLPRGPLAGFGGHATRLLARGRCEGLEQEGLDRVVWLRVARREPPHGVRLVCEVIPGRGNLILVDGEQGRAIQVLHPVPPSDGRPVWPGLAYVPPARPTRPGLIEALDRDRFLAALLPHLSTRGDPARAVREAFDGLSPLMAEEIVQRAGVAPACHPEQVAGAIWAVVVALLTQLESPSAPRVIAAGAGGPIVSPFPLAHRDPATQAPYPTLGEAVLGWLSRLAALRDATERRQRTEHAIRQALRRLTSREAKQQADLAAAEAADADQRAGELLLARKGEVPPGATAVELPDFATGAAVRVVLDPALSPVANAERYFRRARKARRGRAVTAERLAETRRGLATFTGLAHALDRDEMPLEEIERRLIRLGALSASAGEARPPGRARTAPSDEPKLRRFTSSDGLPILVGRDARSNDQLSLRVARGHDLWLHAQDGGGSHVLVRLEARDGEVPPRTLREAAQLAAYYSQARGEAKVAVSYTRAKYVRKPRGARPGLVHITQERTILVRPDPGLIKRLAVNRIAD